MDARLLAIHTYPVKGEPGTDLGASTVEPEGLAGDRRKKSPLHLVALQDAPSTRANLVLDLPADALRGAIGQRVTIGDTTIRIAGTAGTCPGVYADVVRPGRVAVGDEVVVVAADPLV